MRNQPFATILLTLTLGFLTLPAGAQTLLNENFNVDDGNFTAATGGTVEIPWSHSTAGTGSWTVGGSMIVGAGSFATLTSQTFVVPADGAGNVTLVFDHRYSFEAATGMAVRFE